MQYVKAGDLPNAVASMMSDMTKHPETKTSVEGALGSLGLLAAMDAQRGDQSAVERYISGFN
jgi:hypothetical protein